MRISDWSSDVCSSDLGGGMSELLYDEGLRRHMLQVYNYMGLGLAVTGLVAFGVAATPSLYQAIFGTSLKWVAMFAPLAFVLFLSFRIVRMSASAVQRSEERCVGKEWVSSVRLGGWR